MLYSKLRHLNPPGRPRQACPQAKLAEIKNGRLAPGDIPRGYQAHHDFVWKEREWFARRGIDVNNPAFGRWVPDELHKKWHNQHPKFNDYWENLRLLEENRIGQGLPPFTRQELIDKLIEVRTIYSVE